MSIDKGELKILFLEDYGNKIEDLLEGARANLHRCEGSKLFGGLVRDKITGLQARQQKLVEDGEITLEAAEQINKHYQTCLNLVVHMTQAIDADISQARGRVIQLDEVVKLLKKDHSQEVAKRDALLTALESRLIEVEGPGATPANGEARPTGARPPVGLKAQRLAAVPPLVPETPVFSHTLPPSEGHDGAPMSNAPEEPSAVAVKKTVKRGRRGKDT